MMRRHPYLRRPSEDHRKTIETGTYQESPLLALHDDGAIRWYAEAGQDPFHVPQRVDRHDSQIVS
jgi:hypothetical protein